MPDLFIFGFMVGTCAILFWDGLQVQNLKNRVEDLERQVKKLEDKP